MSKGRHNPGFRPSAPYHEPRKMKVGTALQPKREEEPFESPNPVVMGFLKRLDGARPTTPAQRKYAWAGYLLGWADCAKQPGTLRFKNKAIPMAGGLV